MLKGLSIMSKLGFKLRKTGFSEFPPIAFSPISLIWAATGDGKGFGGFEIQVLKRYSPLGGVLGNQK